MNLEVQGMNRCIMKLCRGWAQGLWTHFAFHQVEVQVLNQMAKNMSVSVTDIAQAVPELVVSVLKSGAYMVGG